MRKFLPLFALGLLAFAGCKAPSLPTTTYNLTKLYGQALPEGNGGNIQFDPAAMKYMGSTGCNNFNGSYTLDKKKLTLEPGATTRKMCPDMKQEERFLKMLAEVNGFSQSGSILKLLAGDRVVAEFSE